MYTKNIRSVKLEPILGYISTGSSRYMVAVPSLRHVKSPAISHLSLVNHLTTDGDGFPWRHELLVNRDGMYEGRDGGQR